MRALGAAFAVALCFAPAASAKFRMWLTVGDMTPAVGQRVLVVVHAGVPLSYDLRLMAVAPGRNPFRVAGTITGDVSRPHATIPRDGFELHLTRLTASSWQAMVTFPRAGLWRLVVPSGGPVGVGSPPPVVVPVSVSG
jgi:hypothetical protein